ncbi:MAG: hypothetical protein ABIS20_16890 [Thermoanaerobaculia bacterium]
MHKEAERLVLQAFEAARLAGKKDWRRMTTAVLKNRLLQITEGSFAEFNYGAKNFREFVQLASNILRVDESTIPNSLELLSEDQSIPQERSAPAAERIRPDLWTSVMDYSSGRKFVWDERQHRAQAVSSDDHSQGPLMPTINSEIVDGWREEFAQRYVGKLDEGTWQHLTTWKEKALPSKGLPSALVSAWNRELKTKVSDILSVWFKEHGLETPAGMVEHSEARRDEYLESLRKLVLECVAVMNQRELIELKLPPSAILRIRTKAPLKR